MEPNIQLCGTCLFRNAEGYCTSEKLSENTGQGKLEASDMLIYSYFEGGGFKVGPNFGCVHHEGK